MATASMRLCAVGTQRLGGAKVALGGQRLLALPQRLRLQKRQLVVVKAVLLSPTVLTAAARLAVRLAPGKLLLQAAKRPGLGR